jgi:hypothetical protein
MTMKVREFSSAGPAQSSHLGARLRIRPPILQLAAILFVASILRLSHVTQPFTDVFSWRESVEAMAAENFYRTSWNIFVPQVNFFGPGPGYHGLEFQTVSYFAALAYLVVGQQDWVGRGVAVMFGLWGIFALYQLVRRVWDQERALASAAVMAVLPGSVFVEGLFLSDSPMVALVTTSLWLLVIYLQDGRPGYLLAAAAIAAWGFCTKLPGLIVGLPMAYATIAVLGLKATLRPGKLREMAVFAVLALLPPIAYYLWVRHLALSHFPYHFAGEGNWLWDNGLLRWWDEDYFLTDLRWHIKFWMWTPPVCALVLFGLLFRPPTGESGQRRAADRSPGSRSKRAPWLFHWWILAGVIYYAIGAQELVSNSSNFHLINPAAAALAGHALVVIGSLVGRITRLPTVRVATVGMGVTLLFVAVSREPGWLALYKSHANESYDLGLALREVSQPGDLVVTMAYDFGDPVAIYYSRRNGWIFPPARPGPWLLELPGEDNEAIRMLEELRDNGADWLGIVERHRNDIWQHHRELATYIERTCELKAATQQWVIYRILNPAEIADSPTREAGRLR